MRRALGAIAGPIVVGLLVAACGAGGATGGTGTSAQPTGHSGLHQLGFVKCMRARGVPNMPDPSPNGAPQSKDETTMFGIAIPSSIDTRSPAFQTADQTCQKVLRAGTSPPPGISDTTKEALLANAQCIRTHGVPDYPDPKFPAGGGIETFDGPNDNPQSPAYQHAIKFCGTGR
jgi:hypothetical protein